MTTRAGSTASKFRASLAVRWRALSTARRAPRWTLIWSRTWTFNAVHTNAGVKIDFFVAGADAFEHERLRTRIGVTIGALPTQTLWMDTAEHTVLRKLEWYRRGGEVSDRQWRDIRSIVALQGDKLNRETLSRWASVLGVSDLLARCLDDSA